MVTAVGYIRVSGARQVQGTSLESQERIIREYAERHGYHLERIFTEPGNSAKTALRPVLIETIEYCRRNQNRIQVLIVYKVDRFARFTFDHLRIRYKLQDYGLRLESASEHLEDTPFGRYMETMLAATAQLDNDVRAERAHNACVEAVRAGRWCFRPLVGYRRAYVGKRATAEPDPQVAPLIITALEEIASKRMTVGEARQWLGEQGVKASRTRFYLMLQSKAYAGVIEACGLVGNATPPFTPLIDLDLYRRVQCVLRPMTPPPAYDRNNPDFPLRGTVRCECGQMLTACWSHGKTQRYSYYRCIHCSRVNLPGARVERAFARHLKSLFGKHMASLESQNRTLEQLLLTIKSSRADANDELSRLSQEMQRLQDFQKAVVKKNALGVIPDQLAQSELKEVDLQLSRLSVAYENLRRQQSQDYQSILSFSLSFLANLDDFWRTADVPQKKRLQKFAYPNGIVLDKNYRFRTPPSSPLTEVRASLVAPASRQARLTNKSPKHVAHEQRDAPRVYLILSELYSQFSQRPDSRS